jgi:aminoglycoside phosphotransferase (APT) family kinase protein
LERYARRTGRDLEGIDFYVAFGCWRLAVICEGVYARYVQGKMGDQHDFNLPAARAVVDVLAERALALVRGLG